MNKKALAKWNTEGDLAVIYRLDNLLIFYLKENDPQFKNSESISLERAQAANPYKAIPFSPDNVPGDAVMSVTFAWQKGD